MSTFVNKNILLAQNKNSISLNNSPQTAIIGINPNSCRIIPIIYVGKIYRMVFEPRRILRRKSVHLRRYLYRAIPFFSLSIAWLIRNYRKGKSIVFPALSAMFFFVSAYIYLIFAGKNVPVWVYVVVVLLVVVGAYSTIKKVRRQINEVDENLKKAE